MKHRYAFQTVLLAAVMGCMLGQAYGHDHAVQLSGANEVPPVNSPAKGSGTISVSDDGTVTGSVTLQGIDATMGHIHQGAAGNNGPVLVHLQQSGSQFAVPAGTKLTPDQMKVLQSGGLYVNVHSAAHPGGELRGQIQ